MSRSTGGGKLALAYNYVWIACQQKHLAEFQSAGSSFRMALVNAHECLGANHALTIQCKDAFDGAIRSTHRIFKLTQRPFSPSVHSTPLMRTKPNPVVTAESQ